MLHVHVLFNVWSVESFIILQINYFIFDSSIILLLSQKKITFDIIKEGIEVSGELALQVLERGNK